MPKKAHSEEQIVTVLRQGETGERVADICRKVGISEGTYYAWKKRYAGLGINELRELRQLREENGRLKRLVADLSLDRQILQEIKKALKPGLRRRLGQWAQQTYQIGQRRAARLVRIGWSTWQYKKKVRRFDAVLRRRLCEMAAKHVRYGYRRLTVLLRREGWKVNAKRIYRLYTEEQLIVRTKLRRKLARRERGSIAMATAPNQCWSMDFMSDKLAQNCDHVECGTSGEPGCDQLDGLGTGASGAVIEQEMVFASGPGDELSVLIKRPCQFNFRGNHVPPLRAPQESHMEQMQIGGNLLQGDNAGVRTAIVCRKQASCSSYLSFVASARL
jgi:hypothetical protein